MCVRRHTPCVESSRPITNQSPRLVERLAVLHFEFKEIRKDPRWILVRNSRRVARRNVLPLAEKRTPSARVYVEGTSVLCVGHPQRSIVLKGRVNRIACTPKELRRLHSNIPITVRIEEIT